MCRVMIAPILVLVLAPLAFADGEAPDPGVAALLRNMGYEPEDFGNGTWRFQKTSGGSTYYFTIQPSESGRYLWLNHFLGELPSGGELDAARMVGLLEANGRIGPAHFRIFATEGKRNLYLSMPLEAGGMTPARLRFAIEHVTWAMDDTIALWNVGPDSPPAEGAEGEELSSAKACVEMLFAACKARDATLLAKCFASNCHEDFRAMLSNPKEVAAFMEELSGGRITGEASEQGGRASVPVVWMRRGKEHAETIHCVKEGDAWKVADF